MGEEAREVSGDNHKGRAGPNSESSLKVLSEGDDITQFRFHQGDCLPVLGTVSRRQALGREGLEAPASARQSWQWRWWDTAGFGTLCSILLPRFSFVD